MTLCKTLADFAHNNVQESKPCFQCDAGQNSLSNHTVHHRRQVVEVAVVFVALAVTTGGVQKQTDKNLLPSTMKAVFVSHFFQSRHNGHCTSVPPCPSTFKTGGARAPPGWLYGSGAYENDM